jgi:WD40 repeat protein
MKISIMRKELFIIGLLLLLQNGVSYSQTLQVSLSPNTKVNRSAKNGMATIFFDSNIEDLRIVCTDQNPNEQVTKDENDDSRWYVKIDVKKDLEDYGFCKRIFLLKCSASAEYQLTIDSIALNQVLYYTVTLPNELEPKLLEAKSRRIASKAMDLAGQGDTYLARLLALEALPPNMPYTSDAEAALRHANMSNNARFIGHTQKVNCIAVSSDDCYLVSGADDHKVIIWDTKNANKLKELNIHKDDIVSVQFSNDDQFLLTASSDTTIYLLDAKKGTIIHSYKNGHSAEISVAVFGSHSTIISGDWNGDVVVWDMLTEKVLHKFKAHEKGHIGLAVSSDSRFLLTYSNAQQYPMKIWDVGTYSIIKRFSLEENCSVDKAVFSPEGKKLLATLGAGKMKIYSTSNWEELEERKIDLLGCESACFSPDNKKIALGSTYGHDITILDAATFDTLNVYHCEDKVRDVIFSHDSRMLMACDNSKKIYSWDLNYPFPYNVLLTADDIKNVRFSNGRCLLLTSGNKILEYSSSPDAIIKLKNSYTTKSNVFDLYCSINGDAYYSVVEKYFVDSHNNIITNPLPGVSVFAKKQTVVSLYNLYTNKVLFEKVFDNEIQNVAISDDASLLVVSDAKGEVSLYDLRTGILLESYKDLHKRGITTMSLSKDNDYLLTSDYSDNTCLYHRESKTKYSFNEHTNTCYSVFGNNGLFATYSGDGSIIIWDVYTKKRLNSEIFGLGWHSINKVNFFEDDKRIIVAYNNRVGIWDVSSGLLIDSFEYPNVEDVFFDDKTKIMYIWANDTLKAYRYPNIQELIDINTKKMKGRMLTQEERKNNGLIDE